MLDKQIRASARVGAEQRALKKEVGMQDGVCLCVSRRQERLTLAEEGSRFNTRTALCANIAPAKICNRGCGFI
jgi:hypothetical protein